MRPDRSTRVSSTESFGCARTRSRQTGPTCERPRATGALTRKISCDEYCASQGAHRLSAQVRGALRASPMSRAAADRLPEATIRRNVRSSVTSSSTIPPQTFHWVESTSKTGRIIFKPERATLQSVMTETIEGGWSASHSLGSQTWDKLYTTSSGIRTLSTWQKTGRHSSTSTGTSCMKSRRPKHSKGSGGPAVRYGERALPWRSLITTCRRRTGNTASPIRFRSGRSRRSTRIARPLASPSSRWTTYAKASCMSSGRNRARRSRA